MGGKRGGGGGGVSVCRCFDGISAKIPNTFHIPNTEISNVPDWLEWPLYPHFDQSCALDFAVFGIRIVLGIRVSTLVFSNFLNHLLVLKRNRHFNCFYSLVEQLHNRRSF